MEKANEPDTLLDLTLRELLDGYKNKEKKVEVTREQVQRVWNKLVPAGRAAIDDEIFTKFCHELGL